MGGVVGSWTILLALGVTIATGRVETAVTILVSSIPILLVVGLLTAAFMEVARLFLLVVRYFERETGDPGW